MSPATSAAVQRLAELARPPGSPGEQAAASLLAREFAERGAAARVEAVGVHGTYWVPIGLACAAATVASPAGGWIAAATGLAAAASVADDLEIGRRPLRRLLSQRIAHNVVAEIEPQQDAQRTVVVHAHHDAARTGIVFHPAGAKLMSRVAGRLVDKVGGTPAPMWGAVAGPALVSVGALLRRPRIRRMGAAVSAGYAAAMANIAFSDPVPGANDNLSGVAALLELAQLLGAHPPKHLRVLLLSTGSEESFLEAMVAFGQRHFPALDRTRTTFLCLESVGSPRLMLLSGEGLLTLKRYPENLLGVLSELAERRGVPLRAPFRYRLATDGQVPLRSGYPTAVISSMDWYRAPSNYHWPTDRPANLHLDQVADAVTLAHAFVRWLDDGPAGE